MLYAIVAVLVIIADQWVKFGVQSNPVLANGGTKELIPGILSLVNVHNDGAAFSFLSGGGARIYFIILTGVFVLAVIIALATNFISGRLARWSIVLVAAGGLSNCIDRVMNGYVQDMFKTDFINFPVFNLADVFITVFCLIFVLAILFERESEDVEELDDLYDEDDEDDLPRRPSAKEKRAARVAAKRDAAEEKASRKAKRWFLIAWGITLVLPYYNYYIDPYLWGSCAWNQFGALYYFAGFNGYLLLGHYLKDAEWSLGKTLLLGVPMFAVGYFTTFLGFRHMTGIPGFTEPMAELFWTFNSFNVVLMVIPLFMICKKANVKNERIKAMLADLTKCGFGIYMIHYLLIGPGILLMRALHIPLGMQIPLGAFCALAASWTIVTIAHRILPSKAARVIFG